MNGLPFGVPPFGNEHNSPHHDVNHSSHQGAHQASNSEGNHGSRGNESRDNSNVPNPTEAPEPWPLPPSSLFPDHHSHRPEESTHMHRDEKLEIPDAPDPESERELERIKKLICFARIENDRKKKSKQAKERDEEGGWCVVI